MAEKEEKATYWFTVDDKVVTAKGERYTREMTEEQAEEYNKYARHMTHPIQAHKL